MNTSRIKTNYNSIFKDFFNKFIFTNIVKNPRFLDLKYKKEDLSF